mmetsp:Transcript_41170/g.80584  ORF Transcript_41170/g.80584 Transcript_41170/m.80584 type:complete len:207 (-) Transcript_41170:43-663(-)
MHRQANANPFTPSKSYNTSLASTTSAVPPVARNISASPSFQSIKEAMRRLSLSSRSPLASAVERAHCIAYGSLSVRTTDDAPRAEHATPHSPRPHPNSTTFFPAIKPGCEDRCAARPMAVGHSTAQLGSASGVPRTSVYQSYRSSTFGGLIISRRGGGGRGIIPPLAFSIGTDTMGGIDPPVPVMGVESSMRIVHAETIAMDKKHM